MSGDSAFFSSVRSHHKGSSLVSTSAVPPLSPFLILSLSLPYLFDFSSFSLHIFISLSSPYLTYSHCIYCPILFPRAAADHPAVTPVVSSIVSFASHSRISESHLSYRRRSCPQHRTHTVKVVCHIDNKQVGFYSTLMAMSVETFQQRFQS